MRRPSQEIGNVTIQINKKVDSRYGGGRDGKAKTAKPTQATNSPSLTQQVPTDYLLPEAPVKRP